MSLMAYFKEYATEHGKTLPKSVYPNLLEDTLEVFNSDAIKRVARFGNKRIDLDFALYCDALLETLSLVNSLGLYTTRQSLKAHVTDIALIVMLFLQRRELSKKVSLYQNLLLSKMSVEEFSDFVQEYEFPDLEHLEVKENE